MTLYPKLILDALKNVRYPGTGKNIVEAGMVEDNIRIEGMKVSFSLIFEKSTDPFLKSVVKSAETAIKTYVDKDVEIEENEEGAENDSNNPELKEKPQSGDNQINLGDKDELREIEDEEAGENEDDSEENE